MQNPLMVHFSPSQISLLNRFAALSLLGALMLALRPYNGIRHDSILYFGQALYSLYPDELSRDLFFEYGSQANFTIFPKLMAYFLTYFSAAHVSMAGIMFSFAFFLWSSCALILRLVPRDYLLWALVFVLVWPASYGGFGMLKYQEPYLTARSYTEPLVLLSLALLLGQRRWLALTMLVAAAWLHPLQALPGLAVWWGLQIQYRQRWLWAGIIIAAVVMSSVLGWLDVAPFTHLMQRYDAQWWSSVVESNHLVLMLNWPLHHWLVLAVDVFALLAAWPFMSEVMRRYVKVLLATSALCFAASMLLVDGLRLVLPAGLQLWRIHWLLHWSAVISLPLTLLGLWRLGTGQRPRLVLYGATMMLSAPYGPLTAGYAALLTIPLYLAWPWLQSRITPPYQKLLMAGTLLSVVADYARFASFILRPRDSTFDPTIFNIAVPLLSHPVVILSIVGLAIWCWHAYGRPARLALTGLSLLLLCVAAAGWDQRQSEAQQIEAYSAQPSASPFGYEIESEARVYWADETLTLWLVLHRSSYWNTDQEAGLLFNRNTALVAQRRTEQLKVLHLQEQICNFMNGLNHRHDSCSANAETIKTMCQTAQNELDYLVLPNKVALLPHRGQWNLGNSADQSKNRSFYLYRCKDIL